MLFNVLRDSQPFLQNDSTNEYLKIVQLPHMGMGERHHILPVCMFPEFKKSEWNLVNLSFENHYRVHELLPFMTTGEAKYKLLCAWNQMCGRTSGEFIDATRYAELKRLFAENNPSKREDVKSKKREKQIKYWSDPENITKISGENHHNYGKKMTDAQKKKISLAHTGKYGNANGVKRSEETKNKMRGSNNHIAKSVEINGMLYPTLTDAAKALNVTITVIRYMIKTGRAVDPKIGAPKVWSDKRKFGIIVDGITYTTMGEAAEALDVTYTTLRNWMKKGKAQKLDTTKEPCNNTQTNSQKEPSNC